MERPSASVRQKRETNTPYTTIVKPGKWRCRYLTNDWFGRTGRRMNQALPGRVVKSIFDCMEKTRRSSASHECIADVIECGVDGRQTAEMCLYGPPGDHSMLVCPNASGNDDGNALLVIDCQRPREERILEQVTPAGWTTRGADSLKEGGVNRPLHEARLLFWRPLIASIETDASNEALQSSD